MKYKDEILTSYEKFHNYIFGYVWIVWSLFFFVSLVTYNENDPSFNLSTTNTEIHNYLGKVGSYSSDLIYQIFGESAILYPVLFFIFGINIIRNHIVYGNKVKILSFFGFIFSSSVIFDGGIFGNYLIDTFYYISDMLLFLLSSLILFISFTILVDLRKNSWIVWFAKFKNIMRYVYELVTTFTFRERLRRFFSKKIKYVIVTEEKKQNEDFNKKNKDEGGINEEEITLDDDENNLNLEDDGDDNDKDDNETEVDIKKRKIEIQEKRNEVIKSKDIKQVKIEDYVLPNTNLLKEPDIRNKLYITKEELVRESSKLENVLKDYKINGRVTNVKVGPIVTLFELEPQAGTKSSRVIGLADDIARSMSAVSARISVLFGKNALGIELPNKKRETIYIKNLLESEDYQKSNLLLPMVIGTDISGKAVVIDLSKMPHLLVAGTTGSGKSVAINTMITSLLYKLPPNQCKFIMIDPKMLELSVYEGIPHLLTPVVTEPTKAITALRWVCKEMENRYRIMADLGVRNIVGYNEKLQEAIKKNEVLSRKIQVGYDSVTNEILYENKEIEKREMPYIVVIVDEMADLMITAGKEIEGSIQRIAQKARAAGIHIIMATQRPSVDVITGVIKANFPTRISFQVVSRIDSRTIIGEHGAEQLLGMGDMLYMAGGGKIIRAHGPFVSDGEVEKIVNFIKSQGIKPVYVDSVLKAEEGDNYDDGNEPIIEGNTDLFGNNDERDFYQQALLIVKNERKCSISYIQRKLRIGYNKAASIVEELEKNGILSEPGTNGKREILIGDNKDK